MKFLKIGVVMLFLILGGIFVISETVTFQNGALQVSDLQVKDDVLSIDSTNNRVGIGTTSPTAKLQIKSTDRDQIMVEGNSPYGTGLMFQNTHADNNNEYFGMEWGGAGGNINRAGKFTFWYAGGNTGYAKPIMTLHKGGGVGIGTIHPTAKLDVKGKVKATEYCIGTNCITEWPSGGSVESSGNSISITNAAGNGNSHIKNTAGSGQTNIAFTTYQGAQKMIIANNGNVGIGTPTPTAKLEVKGTTGATSGIKVVGANLVGGLFEGGGQDFAIGTTSNHKVNIITNNVPAITILGDGKIGIGTTTPTAKLEVVGEAKISGISDGTGKVVCIKEDQTLGSCTDAQKEDGTCTCT